MIIFVIAVLAAIFYLAFYVTILSIRKLKVSVFSAYPFDLFFPNERGWSAGFFLVVIILLGVLIFIIAKGNFALGGPA